MILFVDACARRDSRTRRLAEHLLGQLDGEVKTLALYEEGLAPLEEDTLQFRTEMIQKGDLSDEYFRYARQFLDADMIVIAAPYWDMSFPSVLKNYIEHVCISGVTFRYNEQGNVEGLCKAEKMYYVTSAGGSITNRAFGYGYIEALANVFGIRDCKCIAAEGLDIQGNNPEQILQDTMRDIETVL